MPFYDPYFYYGGDLGAYAPYGYWGRSPGYAQPADEPRQAEKPKEGLVKTTTGMTGANVAAMSNAGSGWGGYPGYTNGPPITVESIERVMRDPVIAAAHAFATGPIRTSKSHLVVRDDAPEGAKEFVERVIDPLLPDYLEDAAWSIPFGWAGWQVEWEREDGDYIVRKLHACRHEWSAVLFDKDTGDHIGLRWNGTDVFGLRQFIVTHDRRGSNDYLGRPRVKNVAEVSQNWREANDQTAKLSGKASGVILNIGYPPNGGGLTTNKDAAESFAKRATSGASWITHPTWGGLGIEDLKTLQPDVLKMLSEGTDWPMTTLDMGNQGPAIASLTADKRYLDELKCLGYLVPPEAVLQGTGGNRAKSESQGNSGTAMNEPANQEIYAAFQKGVVAPLLELKYGKKLRNCVVLQPEPLEDPQAVFDRQMLQAAFGSSNPDIQRDVGERDWGAVFDRNGVPKLSEEDMAARDQKKAEAAAQQFDQQRQMMEHKASLAKPGSNGNGRMQEAKADN